MQEQFLMKIYSINWYDKFGYLNNFWENQDVPLFEMMIFLHNYTLLKKNVNCQTLRDKTMKNNFLKIILNFRCTTSGVGAAKAPTPLSSPPNTGYPMFPSKCSETCVRMWWCMRHGTLSLFHLGCSDYYHCIPCCTTSYASGYAYMGRILSFIAKIFSLPRIERLGLWLLHWYSAAGTHSRREAFYPSLTLIISIWYGCSDYLTFTN